MIYITWFLVGLLSIFSIWCIDMRGKPYNEYYFDFGSILISILIILLGYISIFIAICVFSYKCHFINKLIYKIANIGINKKR